ncbi:hypothetical protein SKAU_G00367690 [Synaphobranchus kaupii]|uniref:Uncharacterized protein n=1 Tax=Synaphobranchus kaupii TaxID=118154 RepID=A0A9Q1EFD7_SYNKA|nr:hypothetical protein SKAU_G00367690 [Synaphobranchus kaupii]
MRWPGRWKQNMVMTPGAFWLAVAVSPGASGERRLRAADLPAVEKTKHVTEGYIFSVYHYDTMHPAQQGEQ